MGANVGFFFKRNSLFQQGDQVHKSVFIIFFQGDQLKNRVKKICEGSVLGVIQLKCLGETFTVKMNLCVGFSLFFLSYIDWQKNDAIPPSTPFHWIGELNFAQCRPSIPSHLDCPIHLPNTRLCTNAIRKVPLNPEPYVIFTQWYLVEFLFYLSTCPTQTHTHTQNY